MRKTSLKLVFSQLSTLILALIGLIVFVYAVSAIGSEEKPKLTPQQFLDSKANNTLPDYFEFDFKDAEDKKRFERLLVDILVDDKSKTIASSAFDTLVDIRPLSVDTYLHAIRKGLTIFQEEKVRERVLLLLWEAQDLEQGSKESFPAEFEAPLVRGIKLGVANPDSTLPEERRLFSEMTYILEGTKLALPESIDYLLKAYGRELQKMDETKKLSLDIKVTLQLYTERFINLVENRLSDLNPTQIKLIVEHFQMMIRVHPDAELVMRVLKTSLGQLAQLEIKQKRKQSLLSLNACNKTLSN